MRSKKKYIILLLLVFAILSLVLVGNKMLKKDNKEVNIDNVLKSKAYAYLPDEAKDYIKRVYAETGEVLLTEKNKEDYEPYLNPKYVEYLALPDEKRAKEDLIPKETIVDYVFDENYVEGSNDSLPSRYDLRNVNGKNFVTPVKDQGSLGLCWAFATNSQLESYLLVKNDESYSENSTIFSERQLDYATSINGINEYYNKYNSRMLGGGGNFEETLPILASGLLSNESFDYNDGNYDKKELYEILNYGNSDYEITGTIEVPNLNISSLDLNNEEDILKKDTYLNSIKKNIVNYGGAYVGTEGPMYGCSYYDSNLKTYVIRDDNKCSRAGHAMQIIGWDDELEYKYCADNESRHTAYKSNCSDVVEGKGAWLLKNSWGESYPYVYLTYDSMYSDINFISDVKETRDKEWNNNYKYKSGIKDIIKSKEKLEQVKVYNSGYQKNTIDIRLYINYSGVLSNYDGISIGKIEVSDIGIYTLNVSDKDIIFNEGDNVQISVFGQAARVSEFNLSTSNVNKNVEIKTKDASFKNSNNYSNSNYNVYVYSDTKNLDSNELIDYELYDNSENNLTNYLSYKFNYVADNNVNSLLTIDKIVAPGEYKLRTIYNGVVKDESKIILNPIKKMDGSGTKEDPFVITTPDELAMINDNMSAYYVLGNDIDLFHETKDEDGIFYNGGKGWIPLGAEKEKVFDGHLDGQGHSIIGLYKKDAYFPGGLFYAISPNNNYDIAIKNLSFVDCYIDSHSVYFPLRSSRDNWVSSEGILAFYLGDSEKFNYYISSDVSIEINNIGIYNSKIYGYGDAGSLFGVVAISKNNSVSLNNIYSNSLVFNSYTYQRTKGGIIGYVIVQDNLEDNANLKLNNIISIGKYGINNDLATSFRDSTGESFGGIIGVADGNININNAIITAEFIEDKKYNTELTYGSIIGAGNFTGTLNNIYYTRDYNIVGGENTNFTSSNVIKKNILDLKNMDLYDDWNEFDKYFKIEEIDRIKRLPTLKIIDFKYTDISDITFDKKNKVNIYDYIVPNIDFAKDLSFDIEDISIASIDNDGNITGLKTGNTFIHVISNYDGYEKNVPLKVTNLDYYEVKFDSNGGNGSIDNQEFAYDKIGKLTKNTFTKEGYIFKEWNTKSDGNGTTYTDEQEINLANVENGQLNLYAQWTPIKYTIKFDSNGGNGSIDNQEFTYDESNKLTKNTFAKKGYKFKEWNTEVDGSGTSYSDEQSIKNLTSTDNEKITLYAIWEKDENYIGNNSNDYEGVYDEKEHTINVDIDCEECTIKYSLDDKDYSLTTSPKYKEVGEYTIYYKVFKNNEEVLKSSNKVKIYGIKDIDKTVIRKDNIFIVNNNSFTNISSKINTYSLGTIFNHLDKDNKAVSTDIVKTGDIISVKINNIKDFNYSISVLGDINSDGKVSSADYVKIRKHIMELEKIKDNLYFYAADINKDNKISSADYVKIRKYIMNGESL